MDDDNQDDDIQKQTKARVDAVWEQMNSNFNNNNNKKNKNNTATAAAAASASAKNKNKKNTAASASASASASSSTWMKTLGFNNTPNNNKKSDNNKNLLVTTHDQSKHIAAAALAALNNSPSPSPGKIQITQIKDFAGQPIHLHKLVDAHSKEASHHANDAPSSAVDALLDQIKKKQKLSVLDKTKKDWGDYKGENKGLEHELDAYKKSSNQYLDKLSFLERADYKEFERERDARLALHSRKRSDTT